MSHPDPLHDPENERPDDSDRWAHEMEHPCGGDDNICLVAEARGPIYRCTGKCAYEEDK